MKFSNFTTILVLGTMVLSGCGGGGGSADTTIDKITGTTTSDTPLAIQNQAPTADGGTDKTLQLNKSTNIIGSGSDTDGNIVSYQWKKGNTVLANTASFNYTPTTVGTDALTLTVTDNAGATGSDTMNLTVVNTSAVNTRILPLVIIRIEFTDYQFSSPSSVWSQKIFGINEGQLNHYYNEISYSKFQFKPANETDDVENDGVITVQLDEDHPGMLENNIDKLRAGALLADANINFSQYDTDKNNIISSDELQIMFLVAGGERSTGADPGIWAHAWCMQESTVLDNMKLMSCSDKGGYSAFGEKHFNADTGNDATIGVIAHELGHAVFVLPDLYDTDSSSGGIGNFGLMGGGSWGYKEEDMGPGATPVHMSGWSKAYCGFVIPTVAGTSNPQINVNATSSTEYKLYQVPSGISGEYFLVENRAALGYDRGLYSLNKNSGIFEGGLSILHIDNNKIDCIARNDCNDDETHKLVDVEEAKVPGLDATSTFVGDYNNLFFSGNNDSFTLDSSPNSNRYDGKNSSVSITNISGPGATMSVAIEIN